jgi:hypothetical protein
VHAINIDVYVCYRFTKTCSLVASAPELDLRTRMMYFDEMVSVLEELQTGKSSLQ